MTPEPVTFRVLGVPAPQGSKSVFRGRVVEGSSLSGRAKHRAWRDSVAWDARHAWTGRVPVDEPCLVSIEFRLPRPAGARKMARWQTKKPDIDKLARSVLDALTDAGVLVDDARVCYLLVLKRFADRDDPWTGATIGIGPVDREQLV